MKTRNNEVLLMRTGIDSTEVINQGYAVATAGQTKAGGVGDIKGISGKDHASGDEVCLYPFFEVRPVVLGMDTVTVGMKLTSDDGQLIQATTAGDTVIAIAMGAGDDGDTVNAWIVPPYELGA